MKDIREPEVDLFLILDKTSAFASFQLVLIDIYYICSKLSASIENSMFGAAA